MRSKAINHVKKLQPSQPFHFLPTLQFLSRPPRSRCHMSEIFAEGNEGGRAQITSQLDRGTGDLWRAPAFRKGFNTRQPKENIQRLTSNPFSFPALFASLPSVKTFCSFFHPLLLTVFAFLLAPHLHAQSGMVDTNFNTGDGVDLSVYSIALQPNGQVVIAGNFTSFNDVDRINVARLNADGSRDDKFDPGTNAFGGPYPYVNAIALLSNGQLFAGGSFTNTAATNFSRLNSNGNLDSSFTPNVSDIVNALVVQTNGGVIIGGFFTNVNGQAHAGLARFGSNGALDQTFNPALSGAFGAAYALSLQNDGKILIGGSFTNINGSSRTNIARLNPD